MTPTGAQRGARRAGAAVADAFADVPRFLWLKLALLGGSFRRSVWQIVGLSIASLYGLGIMVALVGGLIAARFVPQTEIVRDVVVLVGAVAVVGFLLLPLVFGVDDTLDPRKFALFGIPASRLSVGLVAGSLVSVPPAVLAVCAFATVITWAHGFWTVVIALIAAAIAIVTCALAGRVSTAIAGFLLDTRRSRELTGVIGVVLVLAISPLVIYFSQIDWGRQGTGVLTAWADVLRFTPVGAAWAAPADAVLGHAWLAVLELAIALATVVLLWLVWRALVDVMLVTPGRTGDTKVYAGLGWFGRVPAQAWSVIAARSLTYWARDSRYWVSIIVIPIIPALVLGSMSVVHAIPGQYLALLPLPIMALFLGWGVHNDVAYDGTAIWLHVVSGTTGLADRVGRLVPVLFLGVPLIVIGTIVSVAFYGDARAALPLIGVSVCELFVGLGLSSVTSALFPYPVPKPGDSPFAQPQNVGAVSALVQGFSIAIIIVLSAPAIVFGVLSVFASPGWAWASLWCGVLVGAAAVVAGVVGGGAIFNRRGPQMLEAAVKAA